MGDAEAVRAAIRQQKGMVSWLKGIDTETWATQPRKRRTDFAASLGLKKKVVQRTLSPVVL